MASLEDQRLAMYALELFGEEASTQLQAALENKFFRGLSDKAGTEIKAPPAKLKGGFEFL